MSLCNFTAYGLSIASSLTDTSSLSIPRRLATSRIAPLLEPGLAVAANVNPPLF